MNNNIKIVLASNEDLDAIHEILVQRCKWFNDKNITQWKLNSYPNQYNNQYFLEQMKENFLYVAKKQDEVVGVMLLKNKDKEYWIDDNKSYYLHHLATKLNNKGIGKIMLEFANNKCLQDKKEYLKFDSWASNNELTNYYENLNFINVKNGEKEGYKYKLWEKKIEK